MAQWLDVSIDIFKESKEILKYNEILLKPDELNIYDAMSALDVGKPKIDCHLMANGIFTVKDAVEKGVYLPDEKITIEEIKKIIGYYLDATAARIEGNNMFQTILLCIYAHKEYEIKNDLLKCVIHSFIIFHRSVEEFVGRKGKIFSNVWVRSDDASGYYNAVHVTNFEETKALVDKFKQDSSLTEITDVLSWLLDCSMFFSNFPNHELPQTPTFVKESEPIGFTQSLHLRDLPVNAPPTLMQVKSHDKSIETIERCFSYIRDIISFPEEESLLDLFSSVSNWSFDHNDCPILPRIVYFIRILGSSDSSKIYEKDIDVFVNDELARSNIPTLRRGDLTQLFSIIIEQLLRTFVMPNTFCCHQTRTMLKICYCLEQFPPETIISPKAKVDQPSHTRILESIYVIWGQELKLNIILHFIRNEIKSEIYTENDYPFLGFLLHHVYDYLAEMVDRRGTAHAIYTIYNHRTKNSKRNKGKLTTSISVADVEKKRDERDKNKYNLYKVYASLCLSFAHAAIELHKRKICYNRNSEEKFFDFYRLFEDRKEKYTSFYLRDFNTANNLKSLFENDQKDIVLTHYKNTREIIKTLPDSDAKQTLLKTVITDSTNFMKAINQGMSVFVSFDGIVPHILSKG